MTIIIFLVVLAVLIFVHELGHFVAAKLAGVQVDEFALGFPPKIFSWRRGETLYSLNLIPFGGYVKIFGEDGASGERSFTSQSKMTQVGILAAGVTGNILLAWLLFSFIFFLGFPLPITSQLSGLPTGTPVLMVTGVRLNSPAARTALAAGDEILSLRHGEDSLTPTGIGVVQDFVRSRTGQEIVLTYREHTSGIIREIKITPAAEITTGQAGLGVGLEQVNLVRLPILGAIIYGGRLMVTTVWLTVTSLGQFFFNLFTGQLAALSASIVGPIGLAGLVGEAGRLGLVYLLSLTALISINLAVINLIPFPALDGGRILFVIIEAFKGSPLKPKTANWLNTLGFSLLILLMLLVTYQDIARLVS